MLAELSRAVESRHPWTRGHALRVADLAVSVGRTLDWPQAQLDVLRVGSTLHDVGKLSLSAELLGKPGELTAFELELVRRHPALGARLVRTLPRVLPGVLYHHERWDGDGYPAGLAGDQIPVEARLIALADAFDAMTTTRPYRAPLAHDDALAELERCAGTQFDPTLTRACVRVWAAPLELAV